MKQRITTILCVILLAVQIGALVKAEEGNTVSGNEPAEEAAEDSEENIMDGSGSVLGPSDASYAELPETDAGEEEQDGAEEDDPAGDGGLFVDEDTPSANDSDSTVDDVAIVSGNDTNVSDNDTEIEDETVDDEDEVTVDEEDDTTVSDNDVRNNDTDVRDNDAEANENNPEVSDNGPAELPDGDDALSEMFDSEDIVMVDGKPMIDTDGDGIPDKELDVAEYEQLSGTVSGDNPEETDMDVPAEDVSGDDLEKIIDYASKNVMSLQIPTNLDFVIDPWEISGKGSVWSSEHIFSNNGETPVKLTLKNIKCKVREGITCFGEQASADTVANASGKAAQLQLVLNKEDVIYVTEESSSYEVIIGAGESLSVMVRGTVSAPKKELWQDGDISISMTYGAAIYEEK